MRAYLITGAAGHLASATVERLRGQDCLIRGLILPEEAGTDDGRITYYRGDVTVPESLDGFFRGLEGFQVVVLHMAALISIRDRVSPRLYDVNVTGTRNILDKCRAYRVKRLVYVSSVHAIPEPTEPAAVRESCCFSKDAVEGAYAKTKAEATQAVLDAGRDGLDVVVVHPSGIIGPGDPGRNHLTQLLQMYLRRSLPAAVKGGYDFVDVRDVAAGVLAAAELGRSGECYLLTNRYVTIPELLDYARDAAGGGPRCAVCPMWLAKAFAPVVEGAAVLAGRRPILTRCSLRVLESRARFCRDKAAAELGYRPRDIRETVADTVAFLRETGLG